MSFIWNTHFPLKRLNAQTTLLIASDNLCYHISHARVSGPRNFFQETGWALRFTEGGFHGRHRLNQIRDSLYRVMSELRSAYGLIEGVKHE
jgi:hypothetical protein